MKGYIFDEMICFFRWGREKYSKRRKAGDEGEGSGDKGEGSGGKGEGSGGWGSPVPPPAPPPTHTHNTTTTIMHIYELYI